MEVTAESLKTAFPDVHQAVHDAAYQAGLTEGQAIGQASGINQGRLEGAKIERERIAGIKAKAGASIASPAIAAMVETLIADGQTTPDQAASAILGAINADLASHKAAFVSDALPPVGAGILPDGGKETKPGFMSMVDEYAKEHKCSKAQAIQAIAAEHPEAHEAWLQSLKSKQKEAGNV